MSKEIEKCECGESEFLQVLPKFNKHQVFCVNCGNYGQAMSTKDKAILSWNTSNRFNNTGSLRWNIKDTPHKMEY